MRKALRSAGVALALSALLSAAGVAAGGPASAATDCWGSGGAHTDYLGNTYGTAYCNAYTSGSVRASGATRGTLYAGNSWFVCQEQWVGYNNPKVGSAENNWWLYTQADTSNGDGYHGWGWFPVTKISGGANWGKVTGLRECGTIPIFAFPTP